jgi:hypothetical protein
MCPSPEDMPAMLVIARLVVDTILLSSQSLQSLEYFKMTFCRSSPGVTLRPDLNAFILNCRGAASSFGMLFAAPLPMASKSVCAFGTRAMTFAVDGAPYTIFP